MSQRLCQIRITLRTPKEIWTDRQVNDAIMAMEDMDITDKAAKFVWDLLQKHDATEGVKVEANW